MNEYKLNSLLFAAVLLVGFTFLYTSCDGDRDRLDDKREPVFPTDEWVTVNFTVNGTGFGESDLTVRKRDFHETAAIPLAEDIYMYATLTEDDAPVRLRSSTLETDARVRILAYTIAGSDTTMATFADYEWLGNGILAPAGPPMTVLSGSYMFVAYSFNDDAPMPAIADTTANIISWDLLWGKTDQAVGIGNATVPINLAHLFSKVTMNLTLDIPDAGYSIDGITDARISSYEVLRLITKSGRLILNSGATIGDVYFDWEFSGNDPTINSKPRYVFMNGQTPFTIQFSSVTIDGASYSINGVYPPFTFNTVLQPGHSYTFTVHFERGPSGTADILYVDNDTLKIGRWGVDNFPLDSILFFKFGGVIGFVKPVSGNWTQSLIRFRPTNANPGNYNSVGGVSNPDTPISGNNISGTAYHTGTNILNSGKGDPCKLVGYTATQIRTMSAATLNTLALTSTWRLPTQPLNHNNDFVRGSGTLTTADNNAYWASHAGQDGGWFPIPGDRNVTAGRNQINANPNGFLPALGQFSSSGVYSNSSGNYMSGDVSSAGGGNQSTFVYMTFNATSVSPNAITSFGAGFTVRCVKN